MSDPFQDQPIKMEKTTINLPAGLKAYARQLGGRRVPKLSLQDVIIEALKAWMPGYDPGQDQEYAAAYGASREPSTDE